VTLNIKFLDHIFLPKMASRKGGQFILTDIISGVDSQLTDSIPYRTCASGGASQKRFAKLKFDTMAFFAHERIPVGCRDLEPQNGIDVSVGAISATADPPQSLTLRVNNQTSATVNGITVRNLSIDNQYRITANVLTDQPAPTHADFTFSVRNSLGQTVSRVIAVKRSAIRDTMAKRVNHNTVGANFDLPIADDSQIVIGCGSASFTYSVSGEIPLGTTFEAPPDGTVRVSGVPVSGGRYTFTVNRNYANGEVLSRTYNVFVQSDLAELAPDLVSWWRGEKDAEDETGRSKGRMVGSVGFTHGKVNQGFNFNGTNGYVGLPSTTFNPSNDFTFDLWFKTNQKGVILGRQNNVEPYNTPQFGATPAIYVDQNGKLSVQMFLDQNNQFTTSQARVDDDRFHHVAVVYHKDSRTRTVYLDGAAIGSINNSPQFASANDKYQFGTGYVNDGIVGGLTGWFNFKGVIDEPTLHTRVLPATQIAEIFRSGGAGKMRVDVSVFSPLERDAATGAIHLRAIGGTPFLSYSIDGGATFQDKGAFLNLAPGTYNIVVKDGDNRTMTRTAIITNPPPNLSLTTEIVSPQCSGAQTGEIRIYPTGATGAVEFSVLNGANVQTSNVFTGLNAGNYTPWIRDINSGNTFVGEIVYMRDPPPLSLAPLSFPNAQVGAAYSQTFTVGGGTAPYSASAAGNFANNFQLPAGLNATVSGATITIGGTPTQSGTFPIKFVVTDRNTCLRSFTFPLTVTAAATYSISGKATYGDQPTKFVAGVTLSAAGTPSATTATATNGAYSLTGLGASSYTVTPSKSGGIGTPFSSIDTSLVLQAIVGLTSLTPQQMLAADSDSSADLSTVDASNILKAIVGLPDTGTVGQWKFLPANRSYSSVTGDLTGQNFEAVIIGDVDGDWAAPGAAAAAAADEQEGSFFAPASLSQGLTAANFSTSSESVSSSSAAAAGASVAVSLPATQPV